ncbi:MAG: response regulator receiver protein [Schlesneria sp.]|nr:response regulator receiver protein [Schlesneria sp.]
MISAQQILVVETDGRLAGETEAALLAIAGMRTSVQSVSDPHRAIEAARSRRPQLVVLDAALGESVLRTLFEELRAVAPESTAVVAFQSRLFDADSEGGSQFMIEALRAGAKDFLRRPLSTEDLQQLLGRLNASPMSVSAKLGKIILFASNKGGVGKSTLAVNVAARLAQSRRGKVLLLDSSLQLGVCATMLNLKPKATLADAVYERQRLDEILLTQLTTPHSCGLDLLASPSDPVLAAQIDDDGITRVLHLARRTYDFVIIDSFPVLDRAVMAMLDLADRTYLVFENVVPTLIGARQFLSLLKGLQIPPDKLRIVLNRYSLKAGCLRESAVATQLDRSIDQAVPFDHKMLLAANLGVPYALRATRWTRLGRALLNLVDDVAELANDKATRRASRANGSLEATYTDLEIEESVT